MRKPLERLYVSITKENLWLYILSILEKKKIHGYKIREEILQQFGFDPGFILPYVVLYRLEKEGYIKGKKEGRRKYYILTKKGKEELKKGISLLSMAIKKLLKRENDERF